MPHVKKSSRCSLGKPVEFAWFGFPEALDGNHLSAATFAFLSAVEADNRELNDFVRATLVAEFQDRIGQASRGMLGNSRKIKHLSLLPDLPLYEIRWQGIFVRERGEGGSVTARNLAVRMYHSEPPELDGVFIGHHIHEKRTMNRNVEREMQNREILKAAALFLDGRPKLWGLR